jgi:hypothetical protein
MVLGEEQICASSSAGGKFPVLRKVRKQLIGLFP